MNVHACTIVHMYSYTPASHQVSCTNEHRTCAARAAAAEPDALPDGAGQAPHGDGERAAREVAGGTAQ